MKKLNKTDLKKIEKFEKEIESIRLNLNLNTAETQYQLFRGEKLTGVDFSNQDLTGSNFREAEFIGCNFNDTLLHYCNFKDAIFDDLSTFKGAKSSMSVGLPANLPGLDNKTPPPGEAEITEIQDKIDKIKYK